MKRAAIRFFILGCALFGVFGVVHFFETQGFSFMLHNVSTPETAVAQQKTKILIVVGHDNEVWGSQSNGVKEVEFNRQLAGYLYDFLVADPYFEPTLSQKDGDYIPELAEYFKNNREHIETFRAERRTAYAKENAEELQLEPDTVKHNRVDEDVANKLYGINMWAEEQQFDVVLHVHFNDYPGRPRNQPGKYSGFVMYVPNEEFKNGSESVALAHTLYDELSRFQPPSNLPVEKDGVIQSQYLIALGGRNSLSIPSVLIEYAYIAESRLHGKLRDVFVREMAYQTYLGLRGVYRNSMDATSASAHDVDGSLMLPYVWTTDVGYGEEDNQDVAALQTFLRAQGWYPPTGKTFNECAINGSFGVCTREALISFQKEKGIEESGVLDSVTRSVLHDF